MRKFVLAAVLAALALAPWTGVRADTPLLEASKLVDKAKWTVESFKQNKERHFELFQREMKTAAGVAIFPNLIKGGFILGAEGGHGVVIARQAGGKWGYPAFYTMGGASIGFQIGGQAAEVILILRNHGAVRSILEHQGKLGADMEVTAVNIGAGMEAAVTANLGADIVAFSKAAGAYGGGSIEGSVLARRTDLNEAFYGPGATPQGIVLGNKFSNPVADGLRTALDIR